MPIESLEALSHIRTLAKAATDVEDAFILHKVLSEITALAEKGLRGEYRANVLSLPMRDSLIRPHSD